MTATTTSLSLTALAICFGASAAFRARESEASPSLTQTPAEVYPRREAVSIAAMGDSLSEAADIIATNDPFRLSNSAPLVRFDPSTDRPSAVAATVAALRPVFTLKAIVGGPPWQALIDGIPGQPAPTLVAPGARFDKIVVRTVTRDSVVLQGPDTSWVLSFKVHS